MIKKELIIRNYEEGDEEGIMKLMTPHWKHLKSKENWEWEFRRCSDGFALIKIAEHNEKIVGHYSSLPLKMKCGDKILAGGKMEGSSVDPNYRGNVASRFFPEEKVARIFDKLIKSMFESAQKAHKDLLWGFPNEAALKGQVRSGYHYMPIPLCYTVLPINLNKTFNFFLSKVFKNKIFLGLFTRVAVLYYKLSIGFRHPTKLKMDKRINVEEIQRFDKKINYFWEKWHSQNNCVTIKRDIKYLNWRFVENPIISHRIFVAENKGEIIGYIVTNIINNSEGCLQGNIVDVLMLKNNEKGLDMLVNRAIAELRKEKADFIAVWMIKGNRNYEMYPNTLRKHNFIILPKYKLHMILKANHSVCQKEFVNDLNNWYITMAFTEGAR